MPEIKIKISSLTEATDISTSDILPINVSGVTKKVTANTLISETISQLPRVFGTYSRNYNNINNITSSNTYILLNGDDGKMITMANVNSCVITVPPMLSNTFSCSIMQTGVGSIKLANTTGSYLFNSANSNTISAMYGVASIIGFGVANNFVITGDVI